MSSNESNLSSGTSSGGIRRTVDVNNDTRLAQQGLTNSQNVASRGQTACSNTESIGANKQSPTQTVTLLEQTVSHLPTLILKLKDKYRKHFDGMNQRQQDEYFQQQIEELRQMLEQNIDKFQQLILSARPYPDDPNFQRKKEMYNNLLKVATATMGKLERCIGDVLADYHRFIDELWNAICNDQDPTPIQRVFEDKINKFMKRSWDPAFEEANGLIGQIHQS